MDEYMVPVCSPQYASDHGLMGEVRNLQQCRLLHDRQAWGLDTDSDEWRTWGVTGISLPGGLRVAHGI